jgi:hypothetical protein
LQNVFFVSWFSVIHRLTKLHWNIHWFLDQENKNTREVHSINWVVLKPYFVSLSRKKTLKDMVNDHTH